ncbi:Mitochondrial thiamine pyrophosphate carrier [Toxocara canis]|uniref:Mitochondrial thiamine pyrophosphate carrier n=1 Tax=Toxocara canis TaxID=6265 RepID=A0A0B2V8U3_TOXCA|nr:Mitochondrial thiamine pyrophosphate carrier [Toxocara canis]
MVGYGAEEADGRQLTASEYSQAGLLSGVATRCIIQPLDVLKIRFQLQEEPLRGSRRGKYWGIVQALLLIRKEEGVTAFWKGHVPAQGLSAIYGIVQFTSFELLTKKAMDIPLALTYRGMTDFLCGAVAGCCAMTAAMPLDVIRTRLVAQGEPKVYRGTLHASFCIWRYEGFRGYFRGLTPSLAQIAPYTGIQFALYNWFVEIWKRFINRYESTGALMCGALAGTASKTLLYPLDMVRHRLQMRGFKRRGFGKTTQCRTMIGTFIHVTRNESILGLFKGLWPSMLKAAANSGFAFLFYELALDGIRAL